MSNTYSSKGGKVKSPIIRRVFIKHKVVGENIRTTNVYKSAITAYGSLLIGNLLYETGDPKNPYILEYEPIMKDKNCFFGNKKTIDAAKHSWVATSVEASLSNLPVIPAYVFTINNEMELILVGKAYDDSGKEYTPTQFYNIVKHTIVGFVTTSESTDTLSIEARTDLNNNQTKVNIKYNTDVKKFILVF
jgi:hypothetical protein